ncbi:MAG: hypothetical protein FWB73_05335 [Treponema sp.]|nr:hypothetical protein [Treponema sp.]
MLFFGIFDGIFIVSMCFRNVIKMLVFLAFFPFLGAFFSSCGPIESLFPSAGNYKINVQINNTPLDECSFAGLNDRLRVSFDESVSNDPDVTALMVHLKDSKGEIAGWKVIYRIDPDAEEEDLYEENPEQEQDDANINITDDIDTSEKTETIFNNDNIDTDENNNTGNYDNDSDNSDSERNIGGSDAENSENKNEDNYTEEGATPDFFIEDSKEIENVNNNKILILPSEYKNGDELIINVRSLDKIPYFPIPDDLPMGQYVIVSSIMNNDNVLQKIEKTFFYLGGKKFAYNGISVNLPGVAESNQLIPRGTLIMLEADIVFDEGLEPYIEWYNGRKKIAEGKLSEGAGYLFWKAPEESGFYSMRAVVFPIENFKDLSGYRRDVSMLVSTKSIDIHLVSENIPRLQHRYIFEGSLNDSKTSSQKDTDFSFKHDRDDPKWKASNGTYGVVTGGNNNIRLPKISFSDESEDWQLLFRFKPENDGGILSVQFGKAVNTFLHLYIEGSNLVLTLTSPSASVSQIYNLYGKPSVKAGISPNGKQTESEVPPEESTENANLNDEEFISLAEEAEAVEPVKTEVIESFLLNDGSFITAGIKFSYRFGFLSAQLNILGSSINSELAGKPIFLEIENINEFQIVLGFLRLNNLPADVLPLVRLADGTQGQTAIVRHEFTAIWDEFALFYGHQKENEETSRQLAEEQSDLLQAAVIEESSPVIYN